MDLRKEIDEVRKEKNKKGILKNPWFWVIIVFSIIIVLGSNNKIGGNATPTITPKTSSLPKASASNAPAASATPFATPSSTSGVKTFGDGTYKAGTDIPAGEYVLVSKGASHFEITADSSGSLSSMISNDNFKNRSIITVTEGQYLKITSCTMYAVKDAPAVAPENGAFPEGMYKFGMDLPEGEYKITPDAYVGYFQITSDSTHSIKSIVKNGNISGEQTVTLKTGQYLILSGAHIIYK